MKSFHNVTAKIPPILTSKNTAKSPGHQNAAPERAGKKVRSLVFLAADLTLAAVSGPLGLCAQMVPGSAQFYSAIAYPFLAGISGRFCSLLPFSLSEIRLYFLYLLCICYMTLHARQPVVLPSRVLFLCGVLLFLFTVDCGTNYYRTPFSYEADATAESSSTKELLALCRYFTNQVNSSLLEIDHSGDLLDGLYPGQMEATPAPPVREFFRSGKDDGAAIIRLGQSYPQLDGYYSCPKSSINFRLLSVQQLYGVYSPSTIEASYNREVPYYNIPHTICHELSHLKGFTWEDEANFIGYLACVGSDSPDFRYSGYLAGWVYIGNALAKADPENYYDLYMKLSPQAARDLDWNSQFWEYFDGPATDAFIQINDRYLKAHNQEDGVRNYGRVVDLMLAYHKEQL